MADFSSEILYDGTGLPYQTTPDPIPSGASALVGAAPDTTPPVITNFSPAPSSTIDATDTISFDVTDEDNLGRVVVLALYGTSGESDVIWNGSAFTDAFTGSARNPITDGYAFDLVCAAGWRDADLTIRIVVHDASGNEGTPLDYDFTVTDPTVPDATVPIISNVTPAPGTPIGRNDPVFFDVTDDGPFRRIQIKAAFEDGTWDLVHDGDDFAPRYAGLSSRTAITGGFRFRIRRTGGWPFAPSITPYPIDAAGNEG